jgi:hypothetical protein
MTKLIIVLLVCGLLAIVLADAIRMTARRLRKRRS